MKNKIIIYLIILLLSVGLLVFSLNKYNNRNKFIKPEFDNAATEGIPTVDENLLYDEIDAEGLYKISLCSKFTLDNSYLILYLTNNIENSGYIKVRIYKKDKVVGESGLIKPGEYLEKIKVKNISKDDDIVVKIMGYEKDTYYSLGVINLNGKVE